MTERDVWQMSTSRPYTGQPYAIKRYTREARADHGKPQRYQRKYATVAMAMDAASKWILDPMVKAVWVYDEQGFEVRSYHSGEIEAHEPIPAFDSVDQADTWAERVREYRKPF
jgi:hypothetical protein